MEVTQDWHWLVMESCQEALGKERKTLHLSALLQTRTICCQFSWKNFHLIYHSCKCEFQSRFFSPMDVQLLCHDLLKKLSTPLNWFCTFVRNQLVIPIWIYSWVLCNLIGLSANPSTITRVLVTMKMQQCLILLGTNIPFQVFLKVVLVALVAMPFLMHLRMFD